jgi:long-subunit acyl-CoA synthetase (AMP-forming)
MTEASAALAIVPPDATRPGSAGRLLPGTEARIVDPLGGDLGPGRTGELWMRGPQVMRGYRNRPEATAATLAPGGWLRTGDLCYVDADGYLFVVDRLKELIKYRAEAEPAGVA